MGARSHQGRNEKTTAFLRKDRSFFVKMRVEMLKMQLYRWETCIFRKIIVISQR